MTPERFHQVDEVFQEALDLPPGERDAFLEKACGPDTALREEVRQLLAHIALESQHSLNRRITYTSDVEFFAGSTRAVNSVP